MNNSTYNAVMREYDAIRDRNRRTLAKKKQEVYRKIPGMAKLDEAISAASMNSLKKAMAASGDDQAKLKEELDNELDSIEKKRAVLLQDNGFPADFLTPIYDCSFCHDTGILPDGKKCVCFKKKAASLLMLDGSVRAIPENADFSHFNLNIFSDEAINGQSPRDAERCALAAGKNFCAHFDERMHNLFISGSTGTGKTFLAGCIAHDLIESGHAVAFVTAFDFFDILQKKTFGKKKDPDDNSDLLGDFFLDCDLLIIDDLGTELMNTFTVEKLYIVLNERLIRKRPTIITSNYSIDQIQDFYSERIFSRLVGNYELITLPGNDVRLQSF